MSNRFWGMTHTLIDIMLFRDNVWVAVFFWLVFPIIIATWFGWVIGDLLTKGQ